MRIQSHAGRSSLCLSLSILILTAASVSSADTTRGEADALRSLGDLPETYISATRTPTPWLLTPGSGTLVKRNTFLRFGGQDFGDLAKYDPTVSAPHNVASSDGTFGYGQTGYSGYNIRGIEGNRILMLVDGIRQPEQFISTSFGQNSNSSGGAGRDYYDPAMFETTEILKGSASALYGSDALGGVVSYRTPKVSDFLTNDGYAGFLRGQYFSRNSSWAGQSFFALRQDQLSILLGYAGRQGHETENNGRVPPNPSQFDSDNFLLKGNWHVDDSHKLGMTYEFFNRDRHVNARSADGFSNIFDKVILNDELQRRSRYSLHWDILQADNPWFDSAESHLYYQRTSNDSKNHSESLFGRVRDQSISFTTDTTGWQSVFHKQLDGKNSQHQLTYGIDLSLSNSQNKFVRTDNSTPFDKNRISFAPTETQRGGLFIQDQIRPSTHSPWKIIAGLRLDHYRLKPNFSSDYIDRINFINAGRNDVLPAEEYDSLTLAPRLDLIYQLDDTSSLYFQYSHGVRNPTAEEISMIFDHPPAGTSPAGSITLPNPDLEEEKSHAFELGYKHDDPNKRLRASVFYTQYSDFIENGVRTGNTSPDGRDILTTVNRGEVQIYGFELSGSWQLEQWHACLQGLELGVSTGRTWGVDRQRDKWLNTIEPWKTVAWIGYTNPEETFGLRLTGTYVAGMKHLDDSSGGPYFRPPSYFTLDASGFYKISENLTLQAGINNVFDEQYWQWSNTRRSGGHLGNATSVDDRSTAPGTNGFISLTYQF